MLSYMNEIKKNPGKNDLEQWKQHGVAMVTSPLLPVFVRAKRKIGGSGSMYQYES